jgi:hypothetical protein
LTRLFWLALALDATVLAVLLTLTLSSRGGDVDGGRAMAMAFSVVLPAAIVGAGAFLFLSSSSAPVRVTALLIVAAPPLLVGGIRLRSAAIDGQVDRNTRGTGYFSNSAMQAAGDAVVRRDGAALGALKGKIDVNATGHDGMTLMQLAVEHASDPRAAAGAGGSPNDVIRALIDLGADPNAGLEGATKVADSTILKMLLDAGASPSANANRPVIFQWLGVIPRKHYILLLDHGVDVNAVDPSGTPLIIETARNDRWDLVLLLMDRGADPLRPDRRGTRLADVVQSRVESTTVRPPEMLADIARVKARLVG